ncbi:NADAR family protein [Plantactinospora sp. KLBMP9567]|uniref:NADAR family protein n=1 Tax=Plantactinospora sp. KLBMP9567 TaxID=3085900 RepID=UPI002980A66A|nr:NADAR family protein [Plantactinospora sp. KLBMP9567]MDW5330481.1 NADAR family protein [Plantactinospora sp. KLBMP9567]
MVARTTPPRTVDELRTLLSGGARPKYLFFWGHQPGRLGATGSGCLSQWWPSPFLVDGVRYATAEHFMMAGKARLFDDAAMVDQILRAPTPGAAKALGQRVRGFDQARWDECRFDLVVAGNVAKFGRHPDLRDYLLGSGDRILVEASPIDRIWGIGLAADDPRAGDPDRWRGLNLLGFALMWARHQLAAATAPAPPG